MCTSISNVKLRKLDRGQVTASTDILLWGYVWLGDKNEATGAADATALAFE